MRVLAIDVGTSSVKAGVWIHGRLKPVVREKLQNRLEGVRAEVPGEALVASVEKAARAACERAGVDAVDAIALDAFSSSTVVCDARGQVRLGAISHADRRSVHEAMAIEAELGCDRVLALAGNRPIPGGIGSSTLRWIATHDPAALRGDARVGQASSLLLQRWTGQWVIDPSQAVFLGLWDIARRQWSEELCAAARVPVQSLPRVMWADEVVGRLSRAAARRLGLSAGTPVVGGCVDTGAAVVAAGLDVGQLVHNAGSTDVLALVLDAPRPDARWLTRPLGTGAQLPPRWLAASTIAASGSAISWIRKTMFRELSADDFDRALRHACDARPTAGAGQAPQLTFSPNLAGDRTQVRQPRARLDGLGLSTTREDILAAMARGLVQASARRFSQLRQLVPVRPDVRTMGGASVLGDAMHRAWPGADQMKFQPIAGEAMVGLRILAEASTQQ